MSKRYALDTTSVAIGLIGREGLERATERFRDYWEGNGYDDAVTLVRTADEPNTYITDRIEPGNDEYLRAVEQTVTDDYSIVAVSDVDEPILKRYREYESADEIEEQ